MCFRYLTLNGNGNKISSYFWFRLFWEVDRYACVCNSIIEIPRY